MVEEFVQGGIGSIESLDSIESWVSLALVVKWFF